MLFLWELLWIQWPDLSAALPACVSIDLSCVGLDLLWEQGYMLCFSSCWSRLQVVNCLLHPCALLSPLAALYRSVDLGVCSVCSPAYIIVVINKLTVYFSLVYLQGPNLCVALVSIIIPYSVKKKGVAGEGIRTTRHRFLPRCFTVT